MTDNHDQQVRLLVQRWVEEINRTQGTEAMDRFMAPDYVWHLAGRNVVGREAVKEPFSDLFAANANVHLKAEDVIVGGDTVVVRWTITGVTRESGEQWERASITIDRVSQTQFLEGWELMATEPWQ